jgi:acetyl-CoA C-acetyltransferase
MTGSVIVGTARTPIGKLSGAFAGLSAVELGGIAIKSALERAGIGAEQVDYVLMGQVLQAGAGQITARQAAANAGIPMTVPAMTLNKVCLSGINALYLADQMINNGDAEVVVAGGMESMTNAPYLLPGARAGYRMGNNEVVDSMINDGLWCAFENYHMGCTGELVADEYSVGRSEQDEFAASSHRKAAAAIKAGKFKDEIVAVEIPQRKGPAIIFDTDETVREDTTPEVLGKLKPAFKKEGTVTAGNAPGVNDGASAVVVTSLRRAQELGVEPMGRIVAQAVSGVEPKYVMMAPVEAVRKLFKKTGWSASEVDLVELNEAFSVAALAVTRELGLDPERVNVNGGAVALGHAIGQSGSRLLTTILYELKRRNAHRGVVALCLGGGNAVAMAVER